MIDPNKKPDAPVSPSEVCYRAFALMQAKQFADAEKLLAGNMARTDDDTAVALYHSAMGVLFKMQGEYKRAWRHYSRAEKLLPDDPALKIISARLLIEQFAEYGQAIRKAKRVLELLPENPAFMHQAYTTMGLAHLKKGERRKAVECLVHSMGHNFAGFLTAKNVDFTLVEALLRRGWGVVECGAFLREALEFSKRTEEEEFIALFERLLDHYRAEYPEGEGLPESAS